MVNALPQRFNPDLLSRDGTCFELVLPQSQLPRLGAILSSTDNDVLVNAVFSRQKKHVLISGGITTRFALDCQRCLEPFEMPLAADLRLLLGDDESAGVSDDDLEIWELDEDTFRPLDLVEEALIMAMPYAAMHVDDDGCRGPGEKVSRPGDKTRPFAALKAQMEKEN